MENYKGLIQCKTFIAFLSGSTKSEPFAEHRLRDFTHYEERGKNDKEIKFTQGDKKQDYKVLIADLSSGIWSVHTENLVETFKINDSSGTIYLQSKDGNFYLKKE